MKNPSALALATPDGTAVALTPHGWVEFALPPAPPKDEEPDQP